MTGGTMPSRPAKAWPGFFRMPVQLFPAALGLAGLTLAWRLAADAMGFAVPVADISLLAISVLTGVLVPAGYALKAISHPHILRDDLTTPLSLAAMATWPMSLMVLAALVQPYPALEAASLSLWLGGAALHAVIAGLFVRALYRARPWSKIVTPGWFIPTAGMAVAPSAGVVLGFSTLSLAMTLVGFAAWLGLSSVLIRRALSRLRLPAALLPSLFVLVAPPALFSSAAAAFRMDGVVTALFFYLSVAMLLPVLAGLIRRYTDIRETGFTYAWWSATFPLATMASAGQKTYAALPTAGHMVMALSALALATLVTAAVGMMTLRSIIQRR